MRRLLVLLTALTLWASPAFGGSFVTTSSDLDNVYGVLDLPSGGTGANLTAAQGGLVYSGASSLAIQSAGTSGYFARSGGTGAPTWFDLFETANAWVLLQTFSAGLTVSGGVVLLPDGLYTAPAMAFSSATTSGFYRSGANLAVTIAGTRAGSFTNTGFKIGEESSYWNFYMSNANGGNVGLKSNTPFGWGSGDADGTLDTILLRDAANTLAQRNGTNAQAFNLYNTWTDASNYERGFMRFTSNILRLGAESAGTGTARNTEIIGGTGTTSTLTLQSTSGVGAAGADIIFKVGNNGATEAGRILNNGRWGMGISPLAPLHVYNTTSGFTPIVRFSDDNSQVGAIQYFEWRGGAVNNKIHGIAADGNGFGIYRVNDAGTAFVNTNPDIGINPNGFVVLGNTTAASLLDLRAGDLTFSGANGQKYVQGRATELVAVGSGISTKATTIQIPADAIVYAVPVYVKTKPGGTATMTVTATTSGTAFQKGANISTNAGTSDPGTKNTPINYNAVAAQTVTFTFDVPTTDALGEIRVDIYYATSTPPTS